MVTRIYLNLANQVSSSSDHDWLNLVVSFRSTYRTDYTQTTVKVQRTIRGDLWRRTVVSHKMRHNCTSVEMIQMCHHFAMVWTNTSCQTQTKGTWSRCLRTAQEPPQPWAENWWNTSVPVHRETNLTFLWTQTEWQLRKKRVLQKSQLKARLKLAAARVNKTNPFWRNTLWSNETRVWPPWHEVFQGSWWHVQT